MKAARALDEVTTTTLLGLLAIGLGLYGWKFKQSTPLWIAGVLIVVVAYYLITISDSHPWLYNDEGYEGEGTWYNKDEEGPSVLGTNNAMAANTIQLEDRPGMVYNVARGTNAFITKDGDIKSYSPISALLNGWTENTINYAE